MKTSGPRFAWVFLVLMTVATADVAAFDKAGRTAFQFVKIGVGARQTAMGEAATSSIHDVNAVFWNPAGITGIRSGEASFSFGRWFADMNHISAAAGCRFAGFVTGLSFSSLRYGEIDEALVPVQGGAADTRTGNTFTGHDLLVGLSIAREFTEQLSIGMQVKFLQEKLFTYSVDIFAFDVGTYYDVGYKGFTLAMAAQNFGPSVKWLGVSNREEGYEIPLVFRIGTSFNLVDPSEGFVNLGSLNHMMVSFDANHTNDFGSRFNVGLEYIFSGFLALRGGYRINHEDGQLSAGVGLAYELSGVELRLDYSFVTYEFLESPHRFSLMLAF